MKIYKAKKDNGQIVLIFCVASQPSMQKAIRICKRYDNLLSQVITENLSNYRKAKKNKEGDLTESITDCVIYCSSHTSTYDSEEQTLYVPETELVDGDARMEMHVFTDCVRLK